MLRSVHGEVGMLRLQQRIYSYIKIDGYGIGLNQMAVVQPHFSSLITWTNSIIWISTTVRLRLLWVWVIVEPGLMAIICMVWAKMLHVYHDSTIFLHFDSGDWVLSNEHAPALKEFCSAYIFTFLTIKIGAAAYWFNTSLADVIGSGPAVPYCQYEDWKKYITRGSQKLLSCSYFTAHIKKLAPPAWSKFSLMHSDTLSEPL